MKVQDLLAKNAVVIDLKTETREELLSHLGNYLASLYDLKNPDSIVQSILEREMEMSTGIGFGIAIPHARISGLDRVYMVAARSATPIDFDSIDDRPVRLVFLMISPVNTATEHKQVLSRLSKIMCYEDMRQQLLSAPTPGDFYNVILEGENKYVD